MGGSIITLIIGIALVSSDAGFGWVFVILGGIGVLGELFGDEEYEGGSLEHQPQIRVQRDTLVDDDGDELDILAVEFKGWLPLGSRTDLTFVTTAFDMTDEDDIKPLLSHAEYFQERMTPVFQHKINIGYRDVGDYATDWLRAGVIPIPYVSAPKSGNRKLSVFLHIVDEDNAPMFLAGWCDNDHAGHLWLGAEEYYHYFEDKGFLEVVEERREARALAVKVAMAVAMADGSADKPELEKIKEWMKRVVKPIDSDDEDDDEELKAALNAALKESFTLATTGNLVLGDICRRLNEIDLLPQKYECLELCYDVMAADGVADPGEMKILKQIAESLDLDPKEVQKIADGVIKDVALGGEVGGTISDQSAQLEQLLGIDSSWEKSKKKRHLRKEFQKWNGRMTTAKNQEERDECQKMLDLIAQLRLMYDNQE